MDVFLCKHKISLSSTSLWPLSCVYIYIYLLKPSSNIEASWNQKTKNKEHDGPFNRQLFIYLEINYPFITFSRMLLGSKRRLEQNITHSNLPGLFFVVEYGVICCGASEIPFAGIVLPVAGMKQGESSLFCMVLLLSEEESLFL